MDYIFKHLGVNTKGVVNHPILMTESVVNPNYCRSRKLHFYHIATQLYDLIFSDV